MEWQFGKYIVGVRKFKSCRPLADEFFVFERATLNIKQDLIKEIEDILAIRWNSEKEKSTPDYEDMEFYSADKTLIITEMDDWWDLPESAEPALKALGFEIVMIMYKGRDQGTHYDL